MYKLLSGGVDILPLSNNLSWDSSESTLSSSLSFNSLSDLAMGQVVQFFINGVEVFRGTVRECTEHKFHYEYICHDYGSYLNNEVIKQFNKTSAKTGISSLLNEFEISHCICDLPTKIDKIYKGETIASIIDDVIEQCEKDQGCNYYKEIVGNTVYINKLVDSWIYPKLLVLDNKNIKYSITDLKNKIIATSGGDDSVKVQYVAQDNTSINRFGVYQKVENVDEKNIAQAKNIALNMLKQLNRIDHNTSIECVVLSGAETIRANRLIYLHCDKMPHGWYKIKSVCHRLESGVHVASIEVGW